MESNQNRINQLEIEVAELQLAVWAILCREPFDEPALIQLRAALAKKIGKPDPTIQ